MLRFVLKSITPIIPSITAFSMAKYEMQYGDWVTVKTWATSNGYTFTNTGVQGNDGVGIPDTSGAASWCMRFLRYAPREKIRPWRAVSHRFAWHSVHLHLVRQDLERVAFRCEHIKAITHCGLERCVVDGCPCDGRNEFFC